MAIIAMLVVAGIVLVVMGINVYNGLVSLKNQVDRSWANVEVILKQRFDEIPQLIQVVEQYAAYEQATLQKVIAARQSYGNAQSTEEKVKAANEMTGAFRGLIALGEAYPDLKANASFIQLQNRVSELENQIADRRENFNDTVTNFNTRIHQLPDVFFASSLGYKNHALYRPEPVELVRPNLKMNLG